jgi:integrase
MPDYVSPHKSGTGFNFQVGVPRALKAYASRLYAITTGYIKAGTLNEAADKAQPRAREVKAVFEYLKNASEAERAAFLSGGGLEGLKARIARHVPAKALLSDPSRFPNSGLPYTDPADGRVITLGDVRLAMLEQHNAQEQEVAALEYVKAEVIKLTAEPAFEYTFAGLYARWHGPADKPRVKPGPARNYKRTADRLAKCFVEKPDVREVTRADARKFLAYLQKNVRGTASQKADIGQAFTLFDCLDSHELPDGNPFVDAKKLRREVGHKTKIKGAFSQQQLRRVIEIAARTGFGSNRVSKRHSETLWMLKLLAYTGARANEIAGLRKGDVRKEGAITYIHLREDHAEKSVKGRKGEDFSRKVPLHSDIAADFEAFAKSVSTDAIFGKFEWSTLHGRAQWLFHNFADFLREHHAEIGIRLVDKINPKTGKDIKQAIDDDGLELTLHRIRGSFENTAEAAGIDQRAIDDITGHKIKTVAGKHYRKQLPLPVLSEAMEKLRPLG